MSTHPLCHWIPYHLQPATGLVKWLYTEGNRFDAPFFDETIGRCLSHPYNSNRFTSTSQIDGLIDLSQTIPALEPSAFIFHVSRCGSTLLSQLLSLPDQHIVLSEVPLLDEILRLPERTSAFSEGVRDHLFRATIRLLGHQRSGTETHLFVKLDSWHLFFYEIIRRLYPSVPIVLLYRRPDEVVRSHSRHPGMQAVPGLLPPQWFGLEPAEVENMAQEAYTAHVLACYLSRMKTIADQDNNAFLLPYQADGMALMQDLAGQLRLTLTEAEWSLIQSRSGFHAKRPGQPFAEETADCDTPEYLLAAMRRYQQLQTSHSANHYDSH